jgi:hypothetical protein
VTAAEQDGRRGRDGASRRDVDIQQAYIQHDPMTILTVRLTAEEARLLEQR